MWCSPLAQAADINWNGFMSIAGGKTLDDDTTYIVEPTTSGMYEDSFSFAPESVMGLQAQAVVSDKLRATVQMVAKGSEDFDTAVDWAYVSYDLTDSLTLNAGRFRLPIYFYSDFLDVGFAYHWVRPPVEVYSTPTSQLEGVNLYHSTFLGDFELETQAWYGGIDDQQETEIGGQTFESYLDAKNNMGISSTVTWDWLKVRLVYNTTDVASEMSGVIPGFGAFDMNSQTAVDYIAAAFMADYGNFIWRSEVTHSATETTTAAGAFGPETTTDTSSKTWYVSAGYNIGDFTPHITHAEINPETVGYFEKVKTNTVGVSWAFNSSAALKFEYSQSERESGMAPPTEVDVVSAAIDIVF